MKLKTVLANLHVVYNTVADREVQYSFAGIISGILGTSKYKK